MECVNHSVLLLSFNSHESRLYQSVGSLYGNWPVIQASKFFIKVWVGNFIHSNEFSNYGPTLKRGLTEDRDYKEVTDTKLNIFAITLHSEKLN